MARKVAVLLDGGFVRKRLQVSLKRFPTTTDVAGIVVQIMAHARFTGHEVYRAFFYDCLPFEREMRDPFGKKVSFANTTYGRNCKALLDALQFEPDFAVRRGTLLAHGWRLGPQALRQLPKAPRAIVANDLVPNFGQKGVDIRIALDMASIALKRVAESIVLVTADTDFVPAMKFARIEGAKVYLHTLGQVARPELKAHADFVL